MGMGGGDFGVLGFIAAFDAKNGKELWRFDTIPRPGEPGNETWAGDSWKTGGAGVWNSGAYDPEANLVYFGTGNPAPGWDGRTRRGDNLYSDSVVALDADTGKLKWYYQFTPHDEVDYDSTQVPRARRHRVAGSAAQGHVVGESKRRGVRARSPHRRTPARQAVRQSELDGRFRREGQASTRAWQSSDRRRFVHHADVSRRHQLGASVLQSEDGLVLRPGLGEHRDGGH